MQDIDGIPSPGAGTAISPETLASSERYEREAERQAIERQTLVKAQVATERQRWWLRWIVLGMVAAVILSAAYLEYEIVSVLLSSEEYSENLIIFAAAPIIAISLVTIFMLMGVFRGFRDRDMTRLPGLTAFRNVTGDS